MQHEDRLKRLKMRCWRRGTKEMDMILGPFADAHAQELDDTQLNLLEALLDENDIEIYKWVAGAPPPQTHTVIIKMLRDSVT